MPGLDGFAVVKKLIDKKISLPQLIFATAFDQYAVKAFEVNAVDYLLKPFDKKRVLQAVEKARARKGRQSAEGQTNDRLEQLVRLLEQQQQQKPSRETNKIMVRTSGRMILVDQKDICFATIQDGVISVATSHFEGQSNCRTLEELLESLDSKHFWRAHRGFVVNIDRIREVVPWFKSSFQLRMDDKKHTEVPVSRAQTKRLRELFGL
jgi:two-component system LytT family response regulator/two-component system response regulator LytT